MFSVAGLWAQGPPSGRGPDGKIKINPDTVYITLSGNQNTDTRTVQVKRTGPPGPPLSVTTAITPVTGGTWLTVSPLSGANLTLTATRGTLGAGQYESNLTVTPTGSTPILVKVFLRIVGASGGPAGLLVRPNSLSFKMTLGGANPEAKHLNVSMQGAGAPAWSASRSITTPAGGNWFQITSNTANGLITVTPNGAGLAVGNYSGTVTVTSGSQNVQIPVSLEVTAAGQGQGQGQSSNPLVIHPRAFNFIRHPGDPVPSPKTLNVKTTRATAQNWTATSTVNWLTVTGSGATPGTIQLTLVGANLPATGHHEGQVRVTSGGVTETARVFFRVVGTPGTTGQPQGPNTTPTAVQIAPRSIEFSSTGTVVAPASVGIQLSSNTAGISFTATRSTAAGGNWLSISAAGGTVPGSFNATANPAGLAPGLYTGLITINLTGPVNEQRNIPVLLRVNQAGGGGQETPRLTLSRGGVTFQATRNAPNPASEQVALEARGATSIGFQTVLSVAGNLNWLTVTPASGTAPTNITLSANASALAAGVYPATVFFQATGATPALSAALNVVLTVVNPAAAEDGRQASAHGSPHGLFIEPSQDFLALSSFAIPVTVRLFEADGRVLTGARVQLVSSGQETTLELNETSQGIYTGTLLNLTGGPVSLVATSTSLNGDVVQISSGGDVHGVVEPLPAIFQGGIVSAANFAPGVTPVAPGSIVSLFGQNLAEASGVATSFPLPRTLAGVKVLVGGIEAPLISVMADAGDDFDQINFQMPVEAAGLSYADVVVLRNNVYSNAEGLSIAPAVPGIFTLGQAGTGAAAALHTNFSTVSSSNPARAGDTILLYATGLGETAPDFRSGQPADTLSRATANVEVQVGGRAARLSFAGMAPGFAGLYQINLEVPDGVSGEAEVKLTAGGISAGEGVTLTVR